MLPSLFHLQMLSHVKSGFFYMHWASNIFSFNLLYKKDLSNNAFKNITLLDILCTNSLSVSFSGFILWIIWESNERKQCSIRLKLSCHCKFLCILFNHPKGFKIYASNIWRFEASHDAFWWCVINVDKINNYYKSLHVTYTIGSSLTSIELGANIPIEVAAKHNIPWSGNGIFFI